METLHNTECLTATIVTFMLEIQCRYSARWFIVGDIILNVGSYE
jgi:hypothetical protein